jgi:hypothetical protein
VEAPERLPEDLLPAQPGTNGRGPSRGGVGRRRAEVQRCADRREAPLVDRDVRARHSGPVAGRGDARGRRPLPLVDDHDRAAEILVVAEVAAGETQQLDRGEEAVADAERVPLDALLGAGERSPVRIGGGVDDPLDPVVALGTHDDPAVAERHAVAQQPGTIGGGIAKQHGVAAGGGEQPKNVPRTGRRPRLQHQRDVCAVAAELCRERERERAAAGKDDAAAGQHALRLHERLRPACRDDARQRPAGKDDGTVVRTGRDQDASRVDRARVLALLDEHDRGSANRDGARPRQEACTRPLGRLDQRAAPDVVASEHARVGDAEADPGLLEDLAAEGRPLVDDGDVKTGRCSLRARGEPGGAAADDDQVVGLFVCHRQGGRAAVRRRPAGTR